MPWAPAFSGERQRGEVDKVQILYFNNAIHQAFPLVLIQEPDLTLDINW